MSYELRAWMICDGCGLRIESPTVENRATHAKAPLQDLKTCYTESDKFSDYMRARKGIISPRWMIASRGRYRTEKHFCPRCADGSPLQTNEKIVTTNPLRNQKD